MWLLAAKSSKLVGRRWLDTVKERTACDKSPKVFAMFPFSGTEITTLVEDEGAGISTDAPGPIGAAEELSPEALVDWSVDCG